MTHRTRIKFCGLSRPDDVTAAVDAGADAIGLVFYPPSSRAVTPAQARELVAGVPPFITVTGLFVDMEPEQVAMIAEQVPLDLVQFHGRETADQCQRSPRPWIKAVRARPDTDWEATLEDWPGARGLLLDAWHPEKAGGTGQVFDWSRIPHHWRSRIILAGGLTPDNVGDAIATVRPYGVDVSGGIESSPGIKDAARMRAFADAVRREDSRYD